jgi:signal transduction histidine kinase
MTEFGIHRLQPVAWLRARPLVADTLLAVIVTLPAVLAHLFVKVPEFSPPSALGVFLVLASNLTLALRRRYVVGTLLVILAAQSWLEAINALSSGWMGVMIAAYSLGAYQSGRVLWRVGIGTWLYVVLFVALGVVTGDAEVGEFISTGVIYASALALGDNIRRRRERAVELVERAERAEREQELLAQRQVQLERVRIARELHDVVAHSVSVMVIQAAAARRQLQSNPDAAEGVLHLVEQTGRDAMSEMRRMLGVLRNEGPDAELLPQPSLADLTTLVGSDVDLPVRLVVSGDLCGVPAGVELSAYRVVQEALTNVRRHAGKVDHVEVSVERTADTLTIQVVDNGRGAATGVTPAGFGLIGMRERVATYDGLLNAGPQPGGGWRVRATFPLSTPVGEAAGQRTDAALTSAVGERENAR